MKINGSLAFDASSASEIKNLRVEKIAGGDLGTAGYTAGADAGRIVFVTANGGGYLANTLYFGHEATSSWSPIASGGTAYPQANGDNLEASLGAGVNQTTGAFIAAAFDGVGPLTGTTSFTNAITQLATYANSNNELAELDDVNVTGVTTGQFLQYQSGFWVDHTIVIADIPSLTVSAAQINNAAATTSTTAELNTLDGITALVGDLNLLTGAAAGTGAYSTGALSTTVLSYLGGATPVTSNIQAQLNGKQPLDATLTALAGLSGTGILVETGVDTFAHRSLVQPAAGITIADANGVAGNPTFALANDLAALEGLATTGLIVRSGDGSAVTRTITGTSGNIVVTDGTGVSGEPTINLAAVSQAATGDFVKVTLDGFGRVVGNTAVVAGDITGLVSSIYVDVAGDTMTGNLNMGTNYVTMTNVPTLGTQAANKAYVDSIAAGLSWKQATDAATTASVLGVYANGTAGVGATIAVGGTALIIDGYTLANGERVLVKDQAPGGVAALDGLVGGSGYNTPGTYNGVALTGGGGSGATANITVVGDAVTSVVLVNPGSGYADNNTLSAAAGDIGGHTPGTAFSVLVNTVSQRAHNGIYDVSGVGAGPVVLTRGTNIDQPGEFLGATVFVANGTVNDNSGWTQTESVATVGTDVVVWVQFSGSSTYIWGDGLFASGNTINVNMGAGIQILPTDEVGLDIVSNKAIQLTGGASGDQLTFVLDTGSGLQQSSSGLKISALGVTNAMLANSSFGLLADSGTDTLNLGDSIHITGNSTQGLSVSVADDPLNTSKFTVTAADAAYVQKGVASFASADFTVVAGAVSIASLSNAQLDNSTITFTGTSGTDAVALGETLTFSSTVSGLVSSTVAANGIALDVRLATASLTGVASFNADQFTVAAGAVSLTATLDDLTNVSSADAAATDDLLTKTAGDWQNVTRAAVVGSTSVADHNDVTVTSAAAGETLVYIGGQWVNRKVFHTEAKSSSTTWTVTHGLGQRYCNVTIADASHEVVIPQSITFDSTTQLTVTFNTAIAGYVMVSGIAAV